MPKYQVVLSDGRKFQVEADSQPSEQDILSHLGQSSAPATPPPTSPTTPPRTWADTAVDALPTIGGIAGGLIGGAGGSVLGVGVGGVPGSVGGAALGGGFGESAKQLINRVRGAEAPSTAGGAAANIGAAGAVQGAGELAGAGAAKVVTPAAKGLYRLALRPIKAIGDKYGIGNLVESGFANRIMPTIGGAKKAEQLVGESKATQRGMAGAYDAAGGAPLSVTQAAKTGVGPLISQDAAAAAATGAPAQGKRLITRVRAVQKANPQGMTAARMMEAKHAADAIADPAYLKAAQPGGAPINPVSSPAIAKGWSKGYRETLNQAIGDDFAQQGRTTKTLYGLKRAAQYAAERPEMASNIMSGVAGAASSQGDVGQGIKNAMITRALFSPRVQAGTALALPGVAHYAPRALDALTGSNLEQYLRQALLARMGAGGAATGAGAAESQ